MCLHMKRHVFMYLDLSRHFLVILIVLSITPFHPLGHNDQNEVKHDFFSHVMPLFSALLSYDENRIINGTNFFMR